MWHTAWDGRTDDCCQFGSAQCRPQVLRPDTWSKHNRFLCVSRQLILRAICSRCNCQENNPLQSWVGWQTDIPQEPGAPGGNGRPPLRQTLHSQTDLTDGGFSHGSGLGRCASRTPSMDPAERHSLYVFLLSRLPYQTWQEATIFSAMVSCAIERTTFLDRHTRIQSSLPLDCLAST